jgi:hypothetical protein
MSFDLWNLGDDDDGQNPVGGDEIKGISCLLPRKKKKGKLYLGRLVFMSFQKPPFILVIAPKPIARHLILSAQPIKPTTDPTVSFKSPQRPSYPKELLKHRFMPYGSQANTCAAANPPMDVDTAPAVPTDDAAAVQPLKPPSTSKEQKGKGKRLESPEIVEVPSQKTKKRKGADVEIIDTPVAKRSKKTKAVS